MPTIQAPTATSTSATAPLVDTGDDAVLPPYFPLKLRKCAEVADTFFACFEKESFPNGDPAVARKAVGRCTESLTAYKNCMEKFVGPRAERR
ncbi:hypothetical protein PhCBS80983_g04904 [Powellomyces hirtus]|uniref:Uncharacterized protein n=1 Tax=Powellomyces hirtus TaxID=109895 RepID=A0A507DWR1_9FUNG|nr:hypothetical protein PhCBS80983_g04904 [Powellomyces hirtus]